MQVPLPFAHKQFQTVSIPNRYRLFTQSSPQYEHLRLVEASSSKIGSRLTAKLFVTKTLIRVIAPLIAARNIGAPNALPRAQRKGAPAEASARLLASVPPPFAIFSCYFLVSWDALFPGCTSNHGRADWVVGSFLFDDRNTDLLTVRAITRLVAKIKNTGREAKPFRTIL